MTYIEHARKVLDILKDYAPTEEHSTMLEDTYDNIRSECSELETLTHMVNMLCDGLSYGNWPWDH